VKFFIAFHLLYTPKSAQLNVYKSIIFVAVKRLLRKNCNYGTTRKVITTFIPQFKRTLLLLMVLFTARSYAPAAENPNPDSMIKRIATGGRVTGVAWAPMGRTYWFASMDRYLYCFSGTDQLLKRARLESRPVSSPVEGPGGSIYLFLENNSLASVTPGAVGAWNHSFDEAPLGNPLTAPDGTVYVVTRTPELIAIAHTGTLRWRIPLPSQPRYAPLLVKSSETKNSRGTFLLVSCENRRSHAYSLSGEHLWEFVSADEVTAPVTDGSVIFLPTLAPTVAAVDGSGIILWEQRLDAAALASAVHVESRTLFLADQKGSVLSISGDDGSIKWKQRAGRSIDSIAVGNREPQTEDPAEAHVVLAASEGGIIRLRENASVAEQMETAPPAGPVVLDEQGNILFGARDWIFSIIYQTRPQDRKMQTQASAVESISKAGPEVKNRFDFIYYQSIATSTDRQSQLKALQTLQERLESPEPDHGTVYIPELLHQFARAGVFSPIAEGGRVINDFPEVRAAALSLISRYGNLSSIYTVSELLRYEWDSHVRIRACNALSSLLDTHDGKALESVRANLKKIYHNRNAEQEVAASSRALFNLAAFHGGLKEEDLDLLLAVAYGPFSREIRQEVLNTLRQGGKRRLY
jgi:hypothetical protein